MKRFTGPRLVENKSEFSKVARSAEPPGTPLARIQKYGYIGDIVSSNNASAPQIFHYVIQHERSAAVAHWGQELSMQRAVESVEEYLEQFKDNPKEKLA